MGEDIGGSIEIYDPGLFIVGWVGEDIGGSIEIYDPGLNEWRMQGKMQEINSSFHNKNKIG